MVKPKPKKVNKKFTCDNCCSDMWVFAVFFVIYFLGFQFASPTKDIIWVLDMLAVGAYCIWNNKQCGRIHCKITGPSFLFVGFLALLSLVKVIDIGWDLLWDLFLLAVVMGYCAEFYYKRKTGKVCKT